MPLSCNKNLINQSFRWIRWIKHVPRFLNPSSSSSNSKNWLNAVLFTIFKKFKKTQYCEFRYFFKNHVNHAFLVGFGQNKAQKWKEQVHFRSRTSYFGGLRSFWSSKYGFFIILVAGQVTVTKEVWTYFTRQKPILVPDGPRPQRKIFLDIFWRVFFLFSSFLSQNFPNASKMVIFCTKFP